VFIRSGFSTDHLTKQAAGVPIIGAVQGNSKKPEQFDVTGSGQFVKYRFERLSFPLSLRPYKSGKGEDSEDAF
jgi:hypothetical protein